MSEDSIPAPKPYRVLCIDGGGMRGIYTAAFLDRLLHQYSVIRQVESLDIGKGFDLISGTSTGAILGCAAAVGRPMSEVVELYELNGAKIFPHRIREGYLSPIYRILAGFVSNGYVRRGDDALKAALDEYLEDVTMKIVFERRGISLSIPTVSMESHRPWVFKKTPKSGVRDDNYRLSDVCLASSAAPIFRSLAAIKNPDQGTDNFRVFADGGLWANNPVLVGMIDALACAADGQEIEIFSIGNVSRPAGEQIAPREVHRSMAKWQFGAAIGPLSIDAQEKSYDDMARFLAGQFSKLGRKVTHTRIPQQKVAATMMPYLGLDDSRKRALKALINQGHEDADLVKSMCDRPDHPEGRMIHSLLNDIPPMKKTGIPMEMYR